MKIFLSPYEYTFNSALVVVFVWFKCFNFSPVFFLEKISCVVRCYLPKLYALLKGTERKRETPKLVKHTALKESQSDSKTFKEKHLPR